MGTVVLSGVEKVLQAGMLGCACHHWARPVAETLGGGGAIVPLDDQSAYLQYPQYRWIFNKLPLSESQGLPAYP